MSRPATDEAFAPPTPSPHAGLVAVVADTARQAGVSCLLEYDGTVLAHAAVGRGLPAAWLESIVTSSTHPLERAGRRLSTAGLLAGGPVVRRLLDGPRDVVLTVPVPVPGLPTHWLWLLTEQQGPALAAVQELAVRIAAALLPDDDAAADREDVAAALEGDRPLPPRLRPACGQLRVMTVVSARGTQPVCAVLSRALLRRGLPPVRIGERVHVVLPAAPAVLEQARDLIAQVQAELDTDVIAVLSDPVPGDASLRPAREQADVATEAGLLPGQCVPAAELRARAAVAVAARAVADLPGPWADPLRALTEAEHRGGPPFSDALLAWLDSNGDVALAAARTGMHHNTLRYRLRRAEDILGAHLDDPDERLELHLRLRARSRARR